MGQQDMAARQGLPPLVTSNELLRAHNVAGGIASAGSKVAQSRKHPVSESTEGIASMIRKANVQEATTQKPSVPKRSEVVVESRVSGASIVGKFAMFRKG